MTLFVRMTLIISPITSGGVRSGSRILGKGGGSDKYIHNWGEGTGGDVPLPDSKGVWGSTDSSPSGVWGEAPAAFLLLRLFSMKFTVISNTYTSRDIRITRACMDSDEKTLHSSQCYGSYCSAIKFVTQSFCEFVTEACTWPCTSYISVYKRLMNMYHLCFTIRFLLSSIAICFLRKRI